MNARSPNRGRRGGGSFTGGRGGFCRGMKRSGGSGGRGGGMKGGSKIIVKPHRHEGVFIAKGKNSALCTKNMVPGEAIGAYNENIISVQNGVVYVVDEGSQKGCANLVGTPQEEQAAGGDTGSDMAKIKLPEVAKYTKGAAGFTNLGHMVDFASIGICPTFPNYAPQRYVHLNQYTWVVDTGASDHLCSNPTLINKLTHLSRNTTVSHADGSLHQVTHAGEVILHPKVILTNTLYVPSYKVNLLSVSKLTDSLQVQVTFFPTHCVFQRLQNGEVLAVGRHVGSLYILDHNSFFSNSATTISQTLCNRYYFP